MVDRDAELRSLVAELRERAAVEEAYLAKSFTDRLLVVDLEAGTRLPEELRERLAAHGLRGANEVYGTDGDRSFAGRVGDGHRHRFVDVRTRGDHQSYVVE